MVIVKLDNYEYDILDIYDDHDDYLYTKMNINFDDVTDPAIHDIFNEVSVNPNVHVNGRYFTCKRLLLEDDAKIDMVTIKLMLLQDLTKGDVKRHELPQSRSQR